MDEPRSPAANQGRIFLALFAALRPHLATDRNLPARLQQLLAREKRFGSRDRRLYRELLYTTIRHLPWIEAKLSGSVPEGRNGPLGRPVVRTSAEVIHGGPSGPALSQTRFLSTLSASETDALRAVAWLAAETPATHAFRAVWTDGWPSTPDSVAARAAHLGVDPAALLPAWFEDHCPAATQGIDFDRLNTRAPLWLRLQTDDPAPVFAEFTARGWPLCPSPALASAFEVLAEADLTATDAYRDGLIEIQDLGSQLLLPHAGVAPGGRWLDACAGAGGKTLQLARLLGPAGRVDAHDIRPAALDELGERARRARIANIRILPRPPAPDAHYDGVLVDAPCSGIGTWRRAPHLKWCTTPETIAQAAALQRELLARFARHVRPGGLLVYATCSLSHCENEDIVTDFLGAHLDFITLPDHPPRTLLPAMHNTDGYYVAPLQRNPKF